MKQAGGRFTKVWDKGTFARVLLPRTLKLPATLVVLALVCVYMTANHNAILTPRLLDTPWAAFIAEQRFNVSQELANNSLADKTRLADLVMERGGTPRRLLVVSTWRAGANLLGRLLDFHPALFYHFEPLVMLETHRVRNRTQDEVAVSHLKRLMNCDYGDLKDYVDFVRKGYQNIFERNHRLWEVLSACDEVKYGLCWHPDFFSEMCRLFPFQAALTVRLPLRLAGRLLDSVPGLSVVLIVRDPRATYEARRYSKECHRSQECRRATMLCADLQQDYWAARRLSELYPPERFKVLRFEEVAVNMSSMFPQLTTHMGLQDQSLIQQYLNSRNGSNDTHVTPSQMYATAPFLWARHIPWYRLKYLQKYCRSVLAQWGYNHIPNSQWTRLYRYDGPQNLTDIFQFMESVDLVNMS